MSQELSREDLKQRLWDETEKLSFGMLGVVGHHMQPMTLFSDRENGSLWFYSHRSSDLVKEAGEGARSMLCLMSKDQEFQACLSGRLTETYDKAKIDQYWSAHVSAWFPEGKDDPELTLLRFDPEDAQVWVSRRGPLKYNYEITKANATHSTPDVTSKAELKL